jgi:hypothetical protein
MTQLAARHSVPDSGTAADTKSRAQGASAEGVVDQRGSSTVLGQLGSMANASPRHDGVRSLKQLAAQGPRDRTNNTGLPAQLKEGIEALSGMRMDHVNVHFNSSKPAQLQAHAFAQGSEIHLAPGQEQHLPHEAWHVVQQAQGRVRPTMQMKGAAINDDGALEREADLMGARALQEPAGLASAENVATEAAVNHGAPVQRYAERGGFKVSENERFAVSADGEPDSQMFVRSPADLTPVAHVQFEPGARRTIDQREYTGLTPRYQSPEARAEMEAMYCGKFSRHATGKLETQESNDAPAGRSLYMRVHGPASLWVNHYAPVVIEDGGDRGTFETAVGLPYMYFGIYGQATEQSFAYKTELAGLVHGLRIDKEGNGLRAQLAGTHDEAEVTKLEAALAQHNEARAKAELILAAMRNPHAPVREDIEADLQPLMAQIREHRDLQFDMQVEAEKEEKTRRDIEYWKLKEEERVQAEAADKQRKSARNKKIATAVVVVLVAIVAILAILL